ncbi:MAG: hypothetical protein JO002_01020 [Burkholderiaceae bacterium]|nr:hypothetical protein [Burkholderiaceae bacterium]
MTFMTSTTVSVLGLFIIAAKWMFNANSKVFGDEGTAKSPTKKKKSAVPQSPSQPLLASEAVSSTER